MKIVISPYSEPYLNLSIENYFFRSWEKQDSSDSNKEDILFLYVNDPCVVMGRFQNPWREVHIPSLKSSNTKMVRRQSGGGTVYHDKGNLNFSFISGQREISKVKNLEMLISFLNRHENIVIKRSPKFDLFFSKEDGDYKISGSAFKQGRVSSIHHGTLLISSALNKLGRSLDRLPLEIETKAINSNPQPVMNLNEVSPELTIKSILDKFKQEYDELEINWSELLKKEEVTKYYKFLKTKEWILDETPRFSFSEQFDFSWGRVKVKVTVNKAHIKSVYLSSNKVKTDWSLWERALEGHPLYEESTYMILMDEIKKIKDQELKDFLRVFFSWMMMSWSTRLG